MKNYKFKSASGINICVRKLQRYSIIALVPNIFMPIESGAVEIQSNALSIVMEVPFEDPFSAEELFIEFSMEFSAAYGFITTPYDIYRIELPIEIGVQFQKLSDSFELTPMLGFVHLHDERLLVLNSGPEEAHSHLRSDDSGVSFDSIRAGFSTEVTTTGERVLREEALRASQLQSVGNLIYSNGGGGINLLVSDDSAESWKVLSGEWQNWPSSRGRFLVTDNIALSGGVGISASIRRAELAPNGLSLVQDFEVVADSEALMSRVALGFGLNPVLGTVLVGVQGGVLRSTDTGQSFDFSLRYDSSVENRIGFIAEDEINNYPFISNFSFSRKYYHRVYATGRDSNYFHEVWGNHWIFVGVSHDDGRTWENHTRTALTIGNNIGFVVEDPNERLLMAVANRENSTLNIAEWHLPDPIADYGLGTEYLGNGWWENAVLGTFNGGHHPWLWLPVSEEWIWWRHRETDESWWFWHSELGWLWSRADMFDWVYRIETAEFIANPFAP